MSKKARIIILSVLAVLIVVVLSVSITTAFMKPIDQGGNITEVSLSSCAKIKLEGTTSIKLTNSYPMSRNKGLQTTPYTFTVTSYCDTYVGFNLYLATLNTNTLVASNIHYIITEKGSKEALVEGTLTSSLDDASNFTDAEKTELNTGLSGTYGNIFKLYNNKVPGHLVRRRLRRCHPKRSFLCLVEERHSGILWSEKAEGLSGNLPSWKSS